MAEAVHPRVVAPLEVAAGAEETAAAAQAPVAEPRHEVPFPEDVVIEPVAEAMPALLPADAPVALMRDRLRALGEPIYGAKAELHDRLRRAEMFADRRRKERDWAAARVRELEKSAADPKARVLPLPPDAPSLEEVKRHVDRQHLPPAQWCETCIQCRSAGAAHLQVRPDVAAPARFELDYSYFNSDMQALVEKEADR
eukprot:199929-Amphidinium_carterae.1